MQLLTFFCALFLLIPDQVWSEGFRGARGAGRGFSGFVNSGSPSAVRPRLGVLDGSLTGHRDINPRSRFGGARFQRRSFGHFTLPGPIIARRLYPPFIYYQWYPFVPYLDGYGYFPYYPGTSIIEVPSSSTSTATSPIGPGLPPENFAAGPSSERPFVRTLPDQLAPFDPTPQEVVDRMLVLAGIRAGDVLYDLGSGDGRILITAAKKYRIKAVGFELDAGLVKLAREKISQENIEQLAEVRHQDFMTADLSSASVVTLYLSHDGNQALKPMLLRQLQSGARVVSYTFDMGDWRPNMTQSYRDAAGNMHTLYYWELPQPQVYSDKAQ